MKKLESFNLEKFGKESSLNSTQMSSIFGSGATKTKGSKTKYSGNGDSDPQEETTSEENGHGSGQQELTPIL